MAGEYLGCGVVAYVGVGVFTGHQKQGLFLVEYDESSDSYTGVSFPQNEEFTQFLKNTGKGTFAPGSIVNAGVAIRIPGLRRYPCDRPDYAFQFVLSGENSDPLLEIMTKNAQGTAEQVIEEPGQGEAPPISQGNEAQDDRPQWQKEGFSSKAEWKAKQ